MLIFKLGVGPKRLELDRSGSYRIHKPSLRQFGIVSAIDNPSGKYSSDSRSREYHIDICTFFQEKCSYFPEKTLQFLEQHRPLFSTWDSIAERATDELGDFISGRAADDSSSRMIIGQIYKVD